MDRVQFIEDISIFVINVYYNFIIIVYKLYFLKNNNGKNK